MWHKENAMGYVLIEAQRLVGNGKKFLPTCLGEIINNVLWFYWSFDQATTQWNCALVRNLYAPHVTNSILLRSLLGWEVKISWFGPMNQSGLFKELVSSESTGFSIVNAIWWKKQNSDIVTKCGQPCES